MEEVFCPYIARYSLARDRWAALNELETPEMIQYKRAVAEQAEAWNRAGYVVEGLVGTWSNIGSLIAQPTFRWGKYALLVDSIIKRTSKGNPDFHRLEEAQTMFRSANARINEACGRWSVIGALLSGKDIKGAVAARFNSGPTLMKTPLMTRLFKKPEVEDDPGLGLEDLLRDLKRLDARTVDLIDNARAWFDTVASCMDSAVLLAIKFADSIHGKRNQQWEEVCAAMKEDFEAVVSIYAS